MNSTAPEMSGGNLTVRTKLHALTHEACVMVSNSLRESIQHFNLIVNPAAPLSAMLRDIDWLSGFLSCSATGVLERRDSDYSRAASVIPRLEHARRIALALRRARDIPGAVAVVRCVAGNVDRLATLHEAAQDSLFELEVASRLAARGLPVSFAEPDILLTYPSIQVGLACKRPRSTRKIVRNIRNGVEQIRRAGLLVGLVAVSLEHILHPPTATGGLTDKKPAPTNWIAGTAAEAEEAIRALALEGLRPSLPGLAKLFTEHPELAGVLLCGSANVLLDSERSYASRWLNFSLSSPHGAKLTERLNDLLQGREGE